MQGYTDYIKYRLYEKLFHLESPTEAMDLMEEEFSSSLPELERAATQAILDYQLHNLTLH